MVAIGGYQILNTLKTARTHRAEAIADGTQEEFASQPFGLLTICAHHPPTNGSSAMLDEVRAMGGEQLLHAGGRFIPEMGLECGSVCEAFDITATD